MSRACSGKILGHIIRPAKLTADPNVLYLPELSANDISEYRANVSYFVRVRED